MYPAGVVVRTGDSEKPENGVRIVIFPEPLGFQGLTGRGTVAAAVLVLPPSQTQGAHHLPSQTAHLVVALCGKKRINPPVQVLQAPGQALPIL